MRIVGALVTGSMLFQFGGCGFGPFLRQAQVGFAEAVGAFAFGLLAEQFGLEDGPGPICIGPGCADEGSGPS